MTGSKPQQYRVCQQLGTVTSHQALSAFARQVGTRSVGFTYSPVTARWFRLDPDGSAWGYDQHAGRQPLDLTGVFELRAFTQTHELRWCNTSAQTGPAVIVSDGDQAAPDTPRRLDEHAYQRLLWGTIESRDPIGDWVTLRDGRIGTLDVPVCDTAPGPGLVSLQAVEYVAEDEYGNVAVVDERLVDLVVTAGQPTSQAKEADA